MIETMDFTKENVFKKELETNGPEWFKNYSCKENSIFMSSWAWFVNKVVAYVEITSAVEHGRSGRLYRAYRATTLNAKIGLSSITRTYCTRA